MQSYGAAKPPRPPSSVQTKTAGKSIKNIDMDEDLDDLEDMIINNSQHLINEKNQVADMGIDVDEYQSMPGFGRNQSQSTSNRAP